MIHRAIIACLLSLAARAAAERADLLRFTNGDQLHGTFLGIKDGPCALWRRDDVDQPVEFKTERVRHVVLHGGRPRKSLGTLSHVGLVNGDRLPGTVTGIDSEFITLETACAGVLRLPRRQVAMLAPNPLGGRLYYHGPFTADDWEMRHALFPEGLPDTAQKAADDEEEDAPGRWDFSGAAWYWGGRTAGTALVRRTGLPDRAVLRFGLAWKNRLSLAVGFHADFANAKPAEEADPKLRKARAMVPGDSADLPRLFGNSYVLQMYSNYMMLFRSAVDGDGDPSLERVQLNNNNLRLGDSGTAMVEIRSDRRSGAISLFVNDDFVAQWSEGPAAGNVAEDFAGKGRGFGFVVQGSDAQVRISDIVVAEWNGMPDSARSMQVDGQDVVLMANGTDRYGGDVVSLDAAGNLLFEGKHGSFRFPISEVAEIRFARDRLAVAEEVPSGNVSVRLDPLGLVSGRPLAGDASSLTLLNPVAGELMLSLDAAVMLDFNASTRFIDDWNADF
jgi:hypothetical protein